MTKKGLATNRSYWGIITTQFLGAFNDNIFKQVVLLLSVKMSSAKFDLQPIPTFAFAIPFLLFSGYAGYLSDKYSKRTIIVLSKVAEIGVMSAGLFAFLAYPSFVSAGYSIVGLLSVYFVLFLMGTQSAFFGPGKYGILPELLKEQELPKANGNILMTTFLAIILGAPIGGFFCDGLPNTDGLWVASAACIFIALIGTATSTLIRPLRAANPVLKFRWSALGIPRETREMLRQDRSLLGALLVSSLFWMVGAIAISDINSYGLKQLDVTPFLTSLMAASIAVGIAAGSVVTGIVSKRAVDFRLLRVGAWGMVISLLVITSIGLRLSPELAYRAGLIFFFTLGFCTGMFAVPLHVFIQCRSDADKKGRMIAVMNQANFTGILLASPVYLLFDQLVVITGGQRCYLFLMTAILFLPIAVLYCPKNDVHLKKGP